MEFKDKDFLQSKEWRKFQEAAGRRTFFISDADFHASIIEHELPIVGKYFYIPRGPIISTKSGMTQLLDLAKKENAGWIRFDASDLHALDSIREYSRVLKAPHDMQPKEVFLIDIKKSEEDLLSAMKSKTRYNIKLAEKRDVRVFCVKGCHSELDSESNMSDELPQGIRSRISARGGSGMTTKYLEEFLKLVEITSKRNGIVPHPESYYRKMFEVIPGDILKLYAAEYEGQVIAANLVIFYEGTATYLHGASDDKYKNLMAPYLLQWKQIQDAKKAGCTKYDFGGVSTTENKGWAGITRFKTSFSEKAKPLEFLGSYDIVINPAKYFLYKIIQKLKSLIR